MAGIGFRLREIVTRKTFTEWIQLYLYAAVIFAGPWIFSIMAIAGLSVFALPALQEDIGLFTVTVVYCYAFSLVTTGIIQLPATRYVADRLYSRDGDSVVPSFVGIVVFIAPIQALTAAAFLAFCSVSLPFKVAAMGLYVVISVIWIAMIYLSAAKDYTSLVLGFFIGYLVSFSLGLWFSEFRGVEGALSGFLAGQSLLCFWLIWRIFEEFPNRRPFNLDFTITFRQYPHLAWAGLFYSLAIWIDKFFFWFSPYEQGGIRIESLFFTHFPYDSAIFFAYLTVIPALALYLVRVETEFYTKYKAYFGGILNKETLGRIQQRRKEMIETLRRNLVSVIVYQGAFTLAVVVLLPWILDVAEISQVYLPLFRVACVAAFFQVFLLMLLVVLLYYDFRSSVMWLSFAFLVMNAGFTWMTLPYPAAFGWGYLGATFFAVLASLVVLWNRIENLEFLTFVQQPIGGEKVVVR